MTPTALLTMLPPRARRWVYVVLAAAGFVQTVFGSLLPADGPVARVLVALSSLGLAVAAGNVQIAPIAAGVSADQLVNRIKVLRSLVPGWWWTAEPGQLPAATCDVIEGIRHLIALLPDDLVDGRAAAEP